MESIVMSGQWDKQCELHKTDVMITKHQLHLVETVMTQVSSCISRLSNDWSRAGYNKQC